MAWRTAHALDTLRVEVNARWPGRSKVSDGTLGDAAHQSRESDHNPWLKVDGVGVVRAFDCTAVGIDPDWYAEHMRALGKAGDPRLIGGGYVIWKKRIASERQGWAWRNYTGANEHRHHVHLSLSRNVAGFDSTAPWGIKQALPPAPAPTPPTNPGGALMALTDKEQTELLATTKANNLMLQNLISDLLLPDEVAEKGVIADRLVRSLTKIEANTTKPKG